MGTAIWSLFRAGAVESAIAWVAGAAADQGLSCARRFGGAAEETSSVKVERRVESQEKLENHLQGSGLAPGTEMHDHLQTRWIGGWAARTPALFV